MALHAPAPERAAGARGFTLAETAGALLILAVAILGIAALHLESRQINNAFDLHNQARDLAEQMLMKIKNNQDPKARYETAVGVVCKPTRKNAAITPLMEVACWQEQVANELPSGNGRIARSNADAKALYTITVSWSQPDRGTASYVAQILK